MAQLSGRQIRSAGMGGLVQQPPMTKSIAFNPTAEVEAEFREALENDHGRVTEANQPPTNAVGSSP